MTSETGADEREAAVARRAHELYEARGGGEGLELDDWLLAEAELDESPDVPVLDRGPNVPVDSHGEAERAEDVMVDVPNRGEGDPEPQLPSGP